MNLKMGNGSWAHSLFSPTLLPTLPCTRPTPAQPEPTSPSSSPLLIMCWAGLLTWASSTSALLPSPLSPTGGPHHQLCLLHGVNDSTVSAVRHTFLHHHHPPFPPEHAHHGPRLSSSSPRLSTKHYDQVTMSIDPLSHCHDHAPC